MADNVDPNDPVQAAGEAVRRMAVDDPDAPDIRVEPGTGSADETDEQKAERFQRANAKLTRWIQRQEEDGHPVTAECRTGLRGKLLNLLRLNVDED